MTSPQLGDASLHSRPCVQVLHDQAHESMASSPSSSDLQLQPHEFHVQASMPSPSSPSTELCSASQLQTHVTCHVHKSRAAEAPLDTPAVKATSSAAPPSTAANGQRGMLELTSLEMFELFLSSGITEPIALHLFSGEPDRADGFAAILKASRVPCLEIDTLVDVRADVSHDHIFELLCALASRGLIIFALIGIPCNTWSVARIGSTFYPFQLRSRTGINGLVKGLTFKQRLEVRLADELGRRAFALAKILDRLRYAFLFEHPVDRGNRRATWFQEKFKDHVSIFATSFAIAFLSQTEVEKVDFCQCACGSVFQKRTTAVASKRIASAMDELRRAQCTHTGPNAHSEQAIGFDKSGKSISARSAPYPAGLNSILAGIAAWWFT